MARHLSGCGKSGTPPPPFTAGRCCCPPQAEVFVKIGARDPATPRPHARRRLPPTGWCSSPSFFFMSFSPSCLQLGGGNPRTPCQPSYSPRGVPPPGPPAVGKVCLVPGSLCLYSPLRHLLHNRIASAPPSSPSCLQLGGGSPRTPCQLSFQLSYLPRGVPSRGPPAVEDRVLGLLTVTTDRCDCTLQSDCQSLQYHSVRYMQKLELKWCVQHIRYFQLASGAMTASDLLRLLGDRSSPRSSQVCINQDVQ